MSSDPNVVFIRLASGETINLRLGGPLRWQAPGQLSKEGQKALALAQEMTDEYHYSPAHGYPGRLLAQRIAKKIGGSAILPPHPPIPEGAQA